jgi:peptide-methionine (S)-S-oxide reductase
MVFGFALAAGISLNAYAAPATAVLAGGCFWSMQTDMEKMPDAGPITVGYTGGTLPNPTYQNHGEGKVPHVEAIRLGYDTAKTSYAQVLDYYFRHIDPTDGGGQFCDRGPTYAPVVFYGDEAERRAALAEKAKVGKELGKPVAVDIRPAAAFWPAEAYHQDYAAKNPIAYRAYRIGCGRDARTAEVWGGK